LTAMPTQISFCDTGAGNISGGWGDYIYHRIGNIGTAGNLTNLAEVILGTPSGAPPPPPTSGGGGTGGGAPDLSVTFLFAFRSGATFVGTEASTFNLCPTATTSNPKITTIPGLKFRITNVGTAAAGAFTVHFVNGPADVNEPGLAAGAHIDIDIP